MAKIKVLKDKPVYKVVDTWELDKKNMILAKEPKTFTWVDSDAKVTGYEVINLNYPIADWSLNLLLRRMPDLFHVDGVVFCQQSAAEPQFIPRPTGTK